jgi:dienelactone hydrolase
MTTRRRRRGILAGATVALAIALAAVLALVSRGSHDAVSVRIEPRVALLDAPLRLEVDGAHPAEAVRLVLSATSADGVLWAGRRTARADGAGRISVDGGSLLAALRPTGVPDSAKLGLVPVDGTVELHLEARGADRALGEASATRRMVERGVSTADLTLRRDGLVGRFWTGPPGERRPTAVLAVGGSEGGYGNSWQAGLLASHGYPVLQLAYFRAPGLPQQLRSIPLEYLARALAWLHARQGVTGVAIVGASRGAELALLVGSTYPALVQGVAAFAPIASVVPGSWTRAGRPVPPSPSHDPAILAERIRGPVLLVAGDLDQVWGAGYGVTTLRARRLAHGATATEMLLSGDAGHALTIAVPYLPEPTEAAFDGFTLVSGGTRVGDALARTAAWPRLLALLERVGG